MSWTAAFFGIGFGLFGFFLIKLKQSVQKTSNSTRKKSYAEYWILGLFVSA